MVDRANDDRVVAGPNPTDGAFKLWQCPGSLPVSFERCTNIRWILLSVLVYMPGEVKYPTQGVNVYPVADSIFYLVNNVYTTLVKHIVNVKVNAGLRIHTRETFDGYRRSIPYRYHGRILRGCGEGHGR